MGLLVLAQRIGHPLRGASRRSSWGCNARLPQDGLARSLSGLRRYSSDGRVRADVSTRGAREAVMEDGQRFSRPRHLAIPTTYDGNRQDLGGEVARRVAAQA